MKLPKKLAAAAVLFLILYGLPAFTLKAGGLPEETTEQTTESDTMAEEPGFPELVEAPAFSARIEYSFQGYLLKGTFTEFPPDTACIQPMSSLDGENWQINGEEWDLGLLGTEDDGELKMLQNQICFYPTQEPFSSYLGGTLDRFYLKLRITRKSGMTYESQTAVIDRGSPQPLPDGVTPMAAFSPDMAVLKTRPFLYYGSYHLTVNENATAEEIAAFLPETIPVEIQLHAGKKFYTKGMADCPVTWKPLSLPQLAAGESLTIADAAEEIVVPAGTMLTTPLGVFELDKPIGINQDGLNDEIRLDLNVIAEGENPTGALSAEKDGLSVAFNLKPTGATAIHAYTFSEGDSGWKEIGDLTLLKEVNAQPSTKNSGYAYLLKNGQEPYQSYLAAVAEGKEPVPFYIGITVEGGVYDGRQMILAWPDTYDLPLELPELSGAGGNEGNAGSGNSDNSTAGGQRQDLPQSTQEQPGSSAGAENTPEIVTKPDSTAAPEKNENSGQTVSPQNPPKQNENNEQTGFPQELPEQEAPATDENHRQDLPQNEKDGQQTDSSRNPKNESSGQRQNQWEQTDDNINRTLSADSRSADTDIAADRNTDTLADTLEQPKRGNYPLPAAAVMAGICIAGIFITAASGKAAAAGKITGKIKHSLRRLFFGR